MAMAKKDITYEWIKSRAKPIVMADGTVHYACFVPATHEEIRKNNAAFCAVIETIEARKVGRRPEECHFVYEDTSTPEQMASRAKWIQERRDEGSILD